MKAASDQDKGYIRQGPGLPSVADQFATLTGAGVLEGYIYTDQISATGRQAPRRRPADLTGREAVLGELRTGDRLVIARLPVLGLSEQDITAVVWQALAAGCAIYAVDLDLTIEPTTSREVVKAAITSAAKALMRSRPNDARKALAELVEAGAVKVGRHPAVHALPPEVQMAAREDWLHNRALTREEVADKYGISAGALRNAFGNRLMPRRRLERSTK